MKVIIWQTRPPHQGVTLAHLGGKGSTMSDLISLEGLDKAEVFAALYNGARAQGLGFLHYDSEPMTAETAQQRFGDEWGYFDYVDGRVMKVDLSGDELNPWEYDRDNGQGAAAVIIAALQATGDTYPEETERIHKEGTYQSATELEKHLDDKTTFEDGVLTLGLDDVANLLRPHLDDILGEEE